MAQNTLDFTFELKAEADDKGVFSGYGSTFGGAPDPYGDIVLPGAFQKTIANDGRNGNENNYEGRECAQENIQHGFLLHAKNKSVKS